MPTKNPRINVALDKSIYATIETLAKKKGVSMSMITRDLIKEAIEINEDAFLADFAEERAKTLNKENTLSHDEIWG